MDLHMMNIQQQRCKIIFFHFRKKIKINYIFVISCFSNCWSATQRSKHGKNASYSSCSRHCEICNWTWTRRLFISWVFQSEGKPFPWEEQLQYFIIFLSLFKKKTTPKKYIIIRICVKRSLIKNCAKCFV